MSWEAAARRRKPPYPAGCRKGGFRKMFVRNVCKPDYDKKQEHDDEECGNEFRRVSASDTIGDHPFGGTYAKPP